MVLKFTCNVYSREEQISSVQFQEWFRGRSFACEMFSAPVGYARFYNSFATGLCLIAGKVGKCRGCC
jgi:hypothetical protein